MSLLDANSPSFKTLGEELELLHEQLAQLREANGAQRVLISEYQKKYAELAAYIDPPSHERPQPKSSRHFLIIGNGRTGSTWLESNFNQLADVRAYRQIGWRLGEQPDHPQRYSVNKSDSMVAIIEAACATKEAAPSHVAGSKLIFQPYTYTHPDVFGQLERVIEPEIDLLLLKRSYLDCFLSWKTRGVAHSIDPEVDAAQRVSGAIESHQPDKPPQHIVLTARGKPMADAAGTRLAVINAIDDILVMFSNDFLARGLVERRSFRIVDYSNIASEFASLTQFIGSRADDDAIRKIIAHPLTQKLPDLTSFLHPVAPLAEFANLLDMAFRHGHPSCLAWQKDNVLRIDIPGLAGSFRKLGVAASMDGNAILWRPLKPLMLV
jgi:hypothetical protein